MAIDHPSNAKTGTKIILLNGQTFVLTGKRDGETGRPLLLLEAAHVEKRLVDRKTFDQRCGVIEDAVDSLARLGVRRHAGLDDDRVGAEATGLPTIHRRADAVPLGFVARCEYNACPHDHGTAAEPRVVSLFHGRIEGVKVGVENLCATRHERMFAYRDRVCRGTPDYEGLATWLPAGASSRGTHRSTLKPAVLLGKFSSRHAESAGQSAQGAPNSL